MLRPWGGLRLALGRAHKGGTVEPIIRPFVFCFPAAAAVLLLLACDKGAPTVAIASPAGGAHIAGVQAAPLESGLDVTFDINVGETQQGTLPSGQSVTLKLISLIDHYDNVVGAVRSSEVQVQVNGTNGSFEAGPYRLPTVIGDFQVECEVTSGYHARATEDYWVLSKDARIRIWPAGSDYLPAGTFAPPLAIRWLSGFTQVGNEPVTGFSDPNSKIYYHFGCDLGAAEGLVDVTAATVGTVVTSGGVILSGYETHPAIARRPNRPDVVTVMDNRGWFWRHSHNKNIQVSVGQTLQIGQKIADLGKEGPSGGWSHLHMDCTRVQPSGDWGVTNIYPFLWEAWKRRDAPALIAVARPPQTVWAGNPAALDASRSFGNNLQFQWTFGDGSSATGPRATKTYAGPGLYSEIVKVTDGAGNVDYDFAKAYVKDANNSAAEFPMVDASYWPQWGIQANDTITFKGRTIGDPAGGGETWDFGDATGQFFTQSDGGIDPNAPNGYAITTHTYAQAGHYIVTVFHERNGVRSTTRLQVRVGDAAIPPDAGVGDAAIPSDGAPPMSSGPDAGCGCLISHGANPWGIVVLSILLLVGRRRRPTGCATSAASKDQRN